MKKTCLVLHCLKGGTLHFHLIGKYSKLSRVKMMCTRGRINAISWNVKINVPKLVDMYGYELNCQQMCSFTQKDLTKETILLKVLSWGGGYFILNHPVNTGSHNTMTVLYCRKWLKRRSRDWSCCWKRLDHPTKSAVTCNPHTCINQ